METLYNVLLKKIYFFKDPINIRKILMFLGHLLFEGNGITYIYFLKKIEILICLFIRFFSYVPHNEQSNVPMPKHDEL